MSDGKLLDFDEKRDELDNSVYTAVSQLQGDRYGDPFAYQVKSALFQNQVFWHVDMDKELRPAGYVFDAEYYRGRASAFHQCEEVEAQVRKDAEEKNEAPDKEGVWRLEKDGEVFEHVEVYTGPRGDLCVWCADVGMTCYDPGAKHRRHDGHVLAQLVPNGKWTFVIETMTADFYSLEAMLAALRSTGWTVASHNDYRQGGEMFTFWLLTRQETCCVVGEAATDTAAVRVCFDKAGLTLDDIKRSRDEQKTT